MIEMSLNGNKWYQNSYTYFVILFHCPFMIKTFSSLDKTHCQKGLSLKVLYFVTEVISGQKCINLLKQKAYNWIQWNVCHFWYYG